MNDVSVALDVLTADTKSLGQPLNRTGLMFLVVFGGLMFVVMEFSVSPISLQPRSL